MQPRGIFSGERIFSRKKLTALCFPPASKRRKLNKNSEWESSYCTLSHKGVSKSSRNKGECFGINRANKWVRVSQSLTVSLRGQSAARTSVFSGTSTTTKSCPISSETARRRSSARATPKPYAKSYKKN